MSRKNVIVYTTESCPNDIRGKLACSPIKYTVLHYVFSAVSLDQCAAVAVILEKRRGATISVMSGLTLLPGM